MSLLDVSRRKDRHKDLLDAAEAFGKCALICYERGDNENLQLANRLALEIKAAPGGDIGWQIVDVGIILTKHSACLPPEVSAHLRDLLARSIEAWSDREFGRGNVNHPVIATWIYAAAGKVLGKPEYSQIADQRLRRFLHIFSQAGDMSEYNSPTYLGPTLVGLANIGMYAEYGSTRLRARLIEERIWLSLAARWHLPTQQLTGPHSRAYADSTLGFGGIVRFLAHAVLPSPVFWDDDLCVAYDHNHDAEWAGKIAACIFSFPDYLGAIAENKVFPYTVRSSTDGEDYSVDGREIYRGGWGSLTSYMADQYCLGSAERPYVDGGQAEVCIAYWQRREKVRTFSDLRALYFRYITNGRLPGQINAYHSWYGGAERTYSANLLHQDGRLHVLQHEGKAIILAQPLKRENGYLKSLRFDALLPLYEPVDEIYIGDRLLGDDLPVVAGWDHPILIRDGDIYLAFIPLEPTDLGGAKDALEVQVANHHLILSIYNLKGNEERSFPAHQLDLAHNGLIFEIGTRAEYGDFDHFRQHVATTRIVESSDLMELRQVRYVSGQDTLYMEYNPATQETPAALVNARPQADCIFDCPQAVQGVGGRLEIEGVSLECTSGVPAWLAVEHSTQSIVAAFPTDRASGIRLGTPHWVIESEAFAAGLIRINTREELTIQVETIELLAPVNVQGAERVGEISLNGKVIDPKSSQTQLMWELS